MSDLLSSLASRAIGNLPTVQPRLASRFEPSPLAASLGFAEPAGEEIETIRTAPPVEAAPAAWPEATGEPTRRSTVETPPRLNSLPHSAVPESVSLVSPPTTLFANDALEQPSLPVRDWTGPEPNPVSVTAPSVSPQTDMVVDAGPLRIEPNSGPVGPVERIVHERVIRELIEHDHEVERVETRSGDVPSVLPVSVASRQLTGQPPHRDVTPVQFEPTPPAIHVTIGRIDVRAVGPAAPAAPPPRSTPRPAGPSLDDYLRQRSGGRT